MSVLTQPESPLQEIDDLNFQAWNLNREDSSKAIELANLALEKSKTINYLKGIALAKKTLGACYIWTSRNDEGVQYCLDANVIFKSLKDKANGANVYVNLGTNFYFLSDYEAAIKYYQLSYDLSAKINFEAGMTDALNGIGTVYYTIDQNEKALKALHESEKLCNKHQNKKSLVNVLEGLGETYYNLKQYHKAIPYLEKCISICKEIEQHQVEAYAYDSLGRTHKALGDYEKALGFFEKSLVIRRKTSFKYGEATTLNNIGNLYLEKKDFAKALKYISDSYTLSLQVGSKEGVYQSSEKLAELYESQNNITEALKYYKIFHQAKEEVRNLKSGQLSKSFELQQKVLQSLAEKAIIEERGKEQESFSESLTLMSQVGQQIISSLEVETIVNTVYQSVNGLMDATGFGIGLCDKSNNTLVFPLHIEEDARYTNLTYQLNEKNRLAVLCFNNSQEIIINDLESEIGNYIPKDTGPKAGKMVESLIYLPLKYKENLLGVVTVQSFRKNAYSKFHVNILKNLATYTAIALENARLYHEQEEKVRVRTLELVKSKEEVERSYQVNKKINEIGRHITSNLNLKNIFKELYESINEIMSVECFGVRIYRAETQTVEYKFEMERGELSDEVHVIPLTDDDNYTVWTVKNKKDIFLNDNRKEYSKYVKQIKVVSGDMPNSLMFTPMMVADKLIGVITVQSFKVNAYMPQHLEILKTLSTYTAIALENAYLYENMEEKVNERTTEVVKQKEEIEKTFENTRLISEIGKEISSTFSFKEIISKVYASVNKLMDATMFGIGIYDPKNEQINFSGVIEKGNTLGDYFYKVSNVDRPAVWCYNNQSDYVILNFTEEFVKSNKVKDYNALQGDTSESIIYVPLTQNNKKIGVITVQSHKPNAYTDYHLQLLKSLAIYTAIALDNASLYNEMEYRVKERTGEISRAYENTKLLSQISEDISSSLSVQTIISKVYQNLNKLMKADCFGIGLVNKTGELLEFNNFVEEGKVMGDFSFQVKDLNRLATISFNEEKEILINDYAAEYTNYIKGIQLPVSGRNTASIIYLPIYSKEKIIGVITIQSFEKHVYSEYQFNLLKNLAVSIGIALDNANLYQNLENKVNERTLEVIKQKEEIEKTFENTRIVSEIGQEISSTFSIREIISKVYNRINKLMDATMFGIGIYDPDNEQINFTGSIEEGEILEDHYFKLSDTKRPAIMCFTNQTDYVILNFTEEFIKSNKVTRNRESLPGRNTESILYIPLTQNNKRIGVITVQSYQPNAYNDYHLQLLKSLAIYAAIALDNASLYNEMEHRVKERTSEISVAYENTKLLSEVAEDISSSLSVETIISKVYHNINKLMKAECFGIGLLDKTGVSLEFKNFVEDGVVMGDFAYEVNDTNRLASQCFREEKSIFINDYEVDYTKYIKGIQAPVSGKNAASIIYLPIYSKSKTIGVITIQSFEKNAYSEYHLNLVKNLAVSVGIALDNANLYQNLEEKVQERTLEVIKQKEQIEKTFEDTRILTKIGNDITSTLSVEEIIDTVYSKLNSLMDAVGFGVGLFNKDTGKIVYPLYIEGADRFSSIAYGASKKDKLAYLCYNQNCDIVINDFENEVESLVGKVNELDLQEGIEIRSIIFLPMVLKEKVIGVITIQSEKNNAYTEYHVQILKNLAVYVAIAIDNAFLYQNMEDMVKERTQEVTKQKELIEKNFRDVKLSAEIAKDIASSLSVETIVSKVYQNVKSIVSAESFGIGLYNPQNNTIEFSGFIEKGEKLPFVYISLEDTDRYGVMCFNKEIEVIINDHSKDYKKYVKSLSKAIEGEFPESLVYLPLYTKEKKIGVLTAQSFSKNAFREYEVNFLKNIALSVAIALDNANLYQNLEQKVEERTSEVHKQKAIIEEKNKDITDSIRYAKKIQQAIAPNLEEFNKNFLDSFILYKPKDIVSGDFYWFEHFGDATVFAAADCTGHGVPGAFMSLICSDIMYKVITEQKVHDPAKALSAIDEKLVKLIRKSSEASANDGMDIALCTYEKKNNLLSYAGAHRPLVLIRDKQIIEYRPNKFSIGGHTTAGKHFDTTEVQLRPGDIVYLLTDGYVDQFGGDNGKKFKFKNFKELVLSICDRPMKEQRKIIEEIFEQWRGSLEQVDDVCVMAMKV